MSKLTESTLTYLLADHSIMYQGWKVKGVLHLLGDINCGERSLVISDGMLFLNGSVVLCNIYHGNKRLLETVVVSGNDTLNRNMPCCGKRRNDEVPQDAMERELHEELGFVKGTYILTHVKSVSEKRMQKYYPGIGGDMTVDHFDIHLPDELWKEEYTLVEDDRTFTFSWVDI